MERVDKDGSGQLDLDEFIAFISELIERRDAYQEFKKVFRYYDNDDDGGITGENIW